MLMHLPNTLKAVEGEKTLYEKVQGYIGAAERWMAQNICEASWISNEYGTQLLGEAVIVNHALYHAIPALDLVLTPNGFGIVNNQNVVPASKERVESLRMSLRYNRDNNLMLLVHALADIEGETWQENTTQGRWFGATMFPWIETVDEFSEEEIGCQGSYWEKYVKLRTKIMEAEQLLQKKFFGTEMMKELRTACMKNDVDVEVKVLDVIKEAKMAVRVMVRKDKGDYASSRENACIFGRNAIEIIRKNPGQFTSWYESEMAAVWAPTLFENKKDNAGYFF